MPMMNAAAGIRGAAVLPLLGVKFGPARLHVLVWTKVIFLRQFMADVGYRSEDEMLGSFEDGVNLPDDLL